MTQKANLNFTETAKESNEVKLSEKQFKELSIIEGVNNTSGTSLNVDLFKSNDEATYWKSFLDLNAAFKAEHNSLNNVLKLLKEFYSKESFKTYNKALLREKGVSFIKDDFNFKEVKNLFNTATFYHSKDYQPNLMVRFAKINDVDKASTLIGEFTNLQGEKQSTKTPKKIYFERVNNQGETVYYTVKPITKFTAWNILQSMVKLKVKALKETKETETEAKK